jgi:hypothetical protein
MVTAVGFGGTAWPIALVRLGAGVPVGWRVWNRKRNCSTKSLFSLVLQIDTEIEDYRKMK